MPKYYKVDNRFPESSSQYKLLQYINANDDVLEFGCASGYMSKYMYENLNCKVYGIELCREALNEALPFLEKGICGDIEELKWKNDISNISFDVIMFADVLEHLKCPEEVVKTALEFLKPEGKVLISVPNIAHGDVVCKLLNNHFDYTPEGLLDNTHIHFWGSENLKDFCEKCGLFIAELNGTTYPMQCTEQRLDEIPSYSLLNIISQNPYSTVYQFVFLAYRKEFAERLKIKEVRTIDGISDMTDFCVSSKVYFDIEGFCESNTVRFPIKDDTVNTKRILVPEKCSLIRFDPIENFNSIVSNLIINSSNGILPIESGNHNKEINGSYYFFNTDPQLYIPLPIGIGWVEISCSIVVIDNAFEQKIFTELLATIENRTNEAVTQKNAYKAEKSVFAAQHDNEIAVLKSNFEAERYQYQEEKNALAAQHEGEIAALKNNYEIERQQYQEEKAVLAARHENEIATLKNKIETEKQQSYKERLAFALKHKEQVSALQKDFEIEKNNLIGLLQKCKNENEQFSSNINNLSNQLSLAQQANSNLQCELNNCRSEYNTVVLQRDELQGQAAYWQNSYSVICNSEFWKLTLPARKLLDATKRVFKHKNQSAIADQTVDIQSNYLDKENVEESSVYLGTISPDKISLVTDGCTDIIIPVYNGFEYLESLFKSIENTKAPYRLIIIDDKSSDKRVLPFLKKYAKGRNNVILLENKNNLGFVKTVNKGLRETKNNVALVNTDVVLPPMWLERLMLPIVAGDKVASSTPFTNCGTICSFPNFCQDNRLFFGMELNDIDKAFGEYTPKYPIIPTGVGFCMGMSRNAIDKVGVLDEDTFGKGYGEENDWCRRTAEKGFVNVHVENLFVYHKHGGSFESEEKKSLINKHSELLSRKHPDYNRLVAEYCQLDPCTSIRIDVKKKLLKSNSKLHTIVAFNHFWGGGASLYLGRERTKKLYEGKEFVQVEYMSGVKTFRIEFFYGDYYETFNVEGEDITKLLDEFPDRVDEIWINELVTYPELFTVLEEIGKYAKAKKSYLLYLFHDYFSVCPTVNLLTPEQKYCYIPEKSVCLNCLANNPRFSEIHQKERRSGIPPWRENWSKFFEKCSEIRVFSEASRDILFKAYPGIDTKHVAVKPHSIDYLPDISKKKKRTKTLNIGVLGGIEGVKGIDIVKQIAIMIKKYELDVNITVIGKTWPVIPEELCHSTGSYERYSLPTNILEYDIDVVLIPSIWPETFSYTSQEAMKMGLPIACFDLGAPAERVKKYDKGIIIPQISADAALNSIIKYADNYINIKSGVANKENKKVLFITEQFDYASHFRAEHFIEELKFAGISADLILLEDAVDKSIYKYSAIIFYCCSSVISASYICARAKELNIKLFFDIDDFVVDKETIISSNLPIERKGQYIGLAESYCDIINKCDGIITSTEASKRHSHHSFPQKPIYLRRNSASLEMETLSVCAGSREIINETDTIYIAYFSVSCICDNDFAIVVKPLLNIFEKYKNVKLQIHGCLHIPQELKEYKSRIEIYDFDSNCRTLPEKIAKVHICLVPLENIVFNECKSENRWIEASLVGRPVVASKNSELELVIKNGVTGFLCGTEKEWEEYMSKLIEDREIRNRIGKNAQEEILRNHLIRNNGNEAVKFITESTNKNLGV